MNIASVKRDVLEGLKDRDYRHAFNLENVYTGLCFQIRALREQRELSQAALGRVAKMAQERISILEDPNSETKPTLNTLLRLASAFDVGLDVRFVSFGTVIDRSVHTNLSQLAVESFADELPMLSRDIETEELANKLDAQQVAFVLPQQDEASSHFIIRVKDEDRVISIERVLTKSALPESKLTKPEITSGKGTDSETAIEMWQESAANVEEMRKCA